MMCTLWTKPALCLVLTSILLGGCGDSRMERAGSGAAIGAGVGIAVGAVCCADPFHGAAVGGLIGGASGAAVGAILDRPLFFNHQNQYWPYDNMKNY